MLGSLFQRKQQTLRKEKTKGKTEETPTNNRFQKGVDGQEANKQMEFWKGRQKENKESKQKRKKTNILKQAFVDKKPLKLQENSLFGPSYKTKAQKHRQQKTKPSKTKKADHKNTTFHFGKQPPIFGNILFFFQVTLFHVCKAVLCWKDSKNSVFSRAQLLCITDSKTPLQGKTQNGTFGCKSAILGFPPCLLKPLVL